MRAYYLSAIILALLQPLVSVGLLVVWPIVFAIFQKKETKSVLWLAFVAGVTVDLILGKYLGLEAIYLLLVAVVMTVVTAKFQNNWQVMLVGGIVFSLGWLVITILI